MLLFAFAMAPLATACVGQVAGELPEGEELPAPTMEGRSPRPTPTTGAPAPPPSVPVVSGPGPAAASPPDTPRFARLSHRQYENTLRDLLGATVADGVATRLVPDRAAHLFDNEGGSLKVTADLWGDYQRQAESLAEKVARDPKLRAAIVAEGTSPEQFIRAFGLRAFRRPLTDGEVARYKQLFDRGAELVAGTSPFADGVQVVLATFLQSPHFLYRSETGTKTAAGVRLDDHSVASKLSYALTASMPDAELLAAASARKLTDRSELRKQAERLLGKATAEETLQDFHDQLFALPRYEDISKDAKKYPLFRPETAAMLKTEAQTFLREVTKKGGGVREIFSAPYSFVNGPLAALYGVEAPAAGKGDAFARVELGSRKRAGLLTQIGFLATYADNHQPQTIMRGAFINHRVLCNPIPPPPDAFMLPEIKGATNRQRVEAATHVAPCSGCHKTLINPPGFALEAYDAVGRLREMDNGLPVDTSVRFEIDGKEEALGDGVSLAVKIAGSEQAHRCYVDHLLEYTFGRAVQEDADAALIDATAKRARKDDLSPREILVDLVTSDAFLSRKN